MNDWRSVQVRTAILKKIESMIHKNIDPTVSNPTQFIDLAIREKLEKLEVSKK